MAAGGNPLMRPDQALQPLSRAGTGPAPQNQFLVNPVIIVTPGRGVFIYSPAPGAGNLIASITATGGTDKYGNAYRAGITSYDPGIDFAQMVNGALALGTLSASSLVTNPGGMAFGPDAFTVSSQPGLQVTSPEAGAGLLEAQLILFGESNDTTKPAQALITSSGGAPATLTLLEVQGAMGLKSAAVPAAVSGYAQPYATANGNIRVVAGSDGNDYSTATLHVVAYPGQTISSITFVNVTGSSAPVAAIHYRWRCVIFYSTTAVAGTPQFNFTTPALTGNMSISATWVPQITPGNSVSRADNGSLSIGAGLTFNGNGAVCTIEADATFSAAGTLQLQALTSAVADTYTIQSVYLDLMPVN